jgi:hypothetical protein
MTEVALRRERVAVPDIDLRRGRGDRVELPVGETGEDGNSGEP